MQHDKALHAKRNAKAAHLETFSEFAFAELSAAPLIEFGVCMRPACGARFDPARAWQVYCCTACRAADTADLRAWGHKAAYALRNNRRVMVMRGDA